MNLEHCYQPAFREAQPAGCLLANKAATDLPLRWIKPGSCRLCANALRGMAASGRIIGARRAPPRRSAAAASSDRRWLRRHASACLRKAARQTVRVTSHCTPRQRIRGSSRPHVFDSRPQDSLRDHACPIGDHGVV